MSALARIKKTAAQHEHERQYDKALALYARLLDGAGAGEEEVDVALFNRAGDLALRVGDAARAVGYFERALDLYAAAGLLNNAVALGVKILRHAPHHLSAHYTLGVLYGRKGFAGDARHHLLTYAVQMQRAGRVDETSRVLAEVAGTCGDVTDLRGAYDAYSALGGDPAYAAPLTSAGAGDAPPAPRPTTTAEPEYLDLSVGTAAGAGAGEAAAVAPPGAGRAADPAAFDAPDLDILELDMPQVDSPAVDSPEVGSRSDSAPASGRAAGLAPAFDPADFGLDASDAAPCGVAAFDATAFGGDGTADDVPAFDGLNFVMTDVPADDAFGLTPAESGAVAPADGDAFGAAGVHPAAAAGDAAGALVFLDVSTTRWTTGRTTTRSRTSARPSPRRLTAPTVAVWPPWPTTRRPSASPTSRTSADRVPRRRRRSGPTSWRPPRATPTAGLPTCSPSSSATPPRWRRPAPLRRPARPRSRRSPTGRRPPRRRARRAPTPPPTCGRRPRSPTPTRGSTSAPGCETRRPRSRRA
jgi:hypothetical protein